VIIRSCACHYQRSSVTLSSKYVLRSFSVLLMLFVSDCDSCPVVVGDSEEFCCEESLDLFTDPKIVWHKGHVNIMTACPSTFTSQDAGSENAFSHFGHFMHSPHHVDYNRNEYICGQINVRPMGEAKRIVKKLILHLSKQTNLFLTQEKIGERIGWSQDKVNLYQQLSNSITTNILDLASSHQKDRVAEDTTTVVTFNFTEGWFRNSGLYDWVFARSGPGFNTPGGRSPGPILYLPIHTAGHRNCRPVPGNTLR
jgi:hypothetical protein